MWCFIQHEDNNKTNHHSLTEHGDKREQKTWFVFTENSLERHHLLSVFHLTSLANDIDDSGFAC